MSAKTQWITWLTASLTLVALFTWSMTQQPASTARTFLPGVTTHGHYQIELQCSACHTPGMGVLQDACNQCHEQDMKLATDTHPRSKFSDPGKAHLLVDLDARKCTTCHREHVPDRTLAMGLSVPKDYCWHCHQEVAEQRPSHKGLAYDSCATAGCHNYHDNRALFEDYLAAHFGEPKVLGDPLTLVRQIANSNQKTTALTLADQDAPAMPDAVDGQMILTDWATTAHAASGVNCSHCHAKETGEWSDRVGQAQCAKCHEGETNSFVKGRHGMRLAASLPAMTPKDARLEMHADSHHKALNCNACHEGHRFNTRHASVEACLSCHDDEHSRAYVDSPHHELWKDQISGETVEGSGVSCATCHLPRLKDEDGSVFVQHNQNDNLRPNDKMLRGVCTSCHGLQFSMNALADTELIRRNFSGEPSVHVKSIEMAKDWSDQRARLREQRKKEREAKKKANTDAEK